jgi:hypothetical protein
MAQHMHILWAGGVHRLVGVSGQSSLPGDPGLAGMLVGLTALAACTGIAGTAGLDRTEIPIQRGFLGHSSFRHLTLQRPWPRVENPVCIGNAKWHAGRMSA